MDLSAYLRRIGFAGPVRPDLSTLEALSRAHARAIPFENIDVLLGRPLATAIPAIYEKLVAQRRGGWCYEQNGLFGWALGEIGFDVRRIAAGVMRAARGDDALGNHLVLLVTLDRPWLVDVGFGGSLSGPLPLEKGERLDAPYTVSLAESEGFWRFTERIGADDPFSFDFRTVPADEALLARQCQTLQVDSASVFVHNLVVFRRREERHLALRGRVLTERRLEGEDEQLVGSAEMLVTLLRQRFGLDLPEAAGLWDKICARHTELFPDTPPA